MVSDRTTIAEAEETQQQQSLALLVALMAKDFRYSPNRSRLAIKSL